jgi:hypothetical protein
MQFADGTGGTGFPRRVETGFAGSGVDLASLEGVELALLVAVDLALLVGVKLALLVAVDLASHLAVDLASLRVGRWVFHTAQGGIISE